MWGDADTDDRFGYALASGDFNRNGSDDLAIGIPYEDFETIADVIENCGAIHILYGYTDYGLVVGSNKQFFQGDGDMVDVYEENDRFGFALASGDFNRDRNAQQTGDIFADLAVGIPYENDTGAVHILYGSINGLTDENNQLWTQDTLSVMGMAENNDRFGYSLAFGDFNRDTIADIAIGVPGEVIIPGGAYHGAINILYGGEPLHTTHKQYANSCGPTSLNMVMEYFGLTDHSQKLYFSHFLHAPLESVDKSHWDAGIAVDVGYKLSMEHIMYEGFWKLRNDDPTWFHPKDDLTDFPFMDSAGFLNNSAGTGEDGNPPETCHDGIDNGSDGLIDDRDPDCDLLLDGTFYEIQYNIGDYNWYSHLMEGMGRLQMWTRWSPGVGGNELPWVANIHSPFWWLDANYLDIEIGPGKDFENIEHVKAVIKGFIDQKIPLVAVVDNRGHFNTLMGYWEHGDDFYIYTADPLDGWGRPFHNKPMRWRKMLLTIDAADARVFIGFVKYGIKTVDCVTAGWAKEIDTRFSSSSLCSSVY
jgi:hypothetical protein